MFLTFSRSLLSSTPTDDDLNDCSRQVPLPSCMQHSFHCMNELCHCLNSLLILYCTHGTAAGFVAGAKQFKPSISIQIYLYAAFPPPNTLYNMASGHDFKICSLASSFSSLSVTSGSSLAKKKLRRFALDKRHLVCDFRNKKRPIDFHLSMKHA